MPQSDTPFVSVTVGPVQISDANAAINPTPSPDQVWVDYYIMNRYEDNLNRYLIGVTSPDGFTNAQGRRAKSAVVQLANSSILWICDWTVAQYNAMPKIPDPDPGDANWILLDRHFEPAMEDLAADGVSVLRRISGTYFYGSLDADAVSLSTMAFPRPPWMQDRFERKLTTQMFERGLSSTSYGLSTGGGSQNP